MTSAQALRATSASRPLEVEAAFYGDGIMLLSDAAERDEDARLFLSSRDGAAFAPSDAARRRRARGVPGS